MTRVLITGATGYVGSRLAHHLAGAGWTVHATVRQESNRSRLPAQVLCHVHDGTAADMVRLVREASPDMVFHLASEVRANHDVADLDTLITANVHFGAQLLEGMAQSGCQRLIEAGTYWEYDAAGNYCPNSLYAASKHAFRVLTEFHVRRDGLRAITMILYDIYGPGDWRGKFLSQLARALAREEPIAATPGEQRLDMVHVDDVVRGFAHAAGILQRGDTGSGVACYRLDTGRVVTLRELAELLACLAGRRSRVRWGERPYPPMQIMQPLANGPRLPGWEPRISLEEGLAALVQEMDAADAAPGALRR